MNSFYYFVTERNRLKIDTFTSSQKYKIFIKSEIRELLFKKNKIKRAKVTSS
jgi:hypothetical protein